MASVNSYVKSPKLLYMYIPINISIAIHKHPPIAHRHGLLPASLPPAARCSDVAWPFQPRCGAAPRRLAGAAAVRGENFTVMKNWLVVDLPLWLIYGYYMVNDG